MFVTNWERRARRGPVLAIAVVFNNHDLRSDLPRILVLMLSRDLFSRDLVSFSLARRVAILVYLSLVFADARQLLANPGNQLSLNASDSESRLSTLYPQGLSSEEPKLTSFCRI